MEPKNPDLEQIRGARILLAEDNEINRQIAVELLEYEGFVVVEVVNGSEAVEYLARSGETIPDAVLMDIQMPKMDGYSAAREIRRFETENQKDRIPIIAMTAHVVAGEREKCIGSGMDDYLAKPVDPERLYELLAKWVRPGAVEKREHQPRNETEGELPETIDGIDIDAALIRVAGNKKLLRDLILSVGKNHTDFPEKIRNAMAERDFLLAIRLIHTIKGIAGNIGADALHRSAERLEDALREEDIDNIEKLENNFARESERILSSATLLDRDADVGGSGDPKEKVPEDTERTIELLKEFEGLLFTDLAEAMTHVETLAPILGNSIAASEFRILTEAMRIFDFEGVMAGVNQIIRKLENG